MRIPSTVNVFSAANVMRFSCRMTLLLPNDFDCNSPSKGAASRGLLLLRHSCRLMLLNLDPRAHSGDTGRYSRSFGSSAEGFRARLLQPQQASPSAANGTLLGYAECPERTLRLHNRFAEKGRRSEGGGAQ